MKYKSIKEKNYNLQLINVDNFRSCHLALIFRTKFDPKKAVIFSLLSDILTDANIDYPSSKYVSRFCEENYILNFYGTFTTTGRLMHTCIVLDYVDPKYIDEKDYLDNIYKFLFNMLKKPLVKDKVFDEKLFNLAKKRLVEDLISYDDDNNFKAIHKALKLFAPSTPTSFHLSDMIDYLNDLTNEDLYEFYEELIKEHVDIFVTGSIDEEKIKKLLNKYYPFKTDKKMEETELIYHPNRLIPIKKVEKSRFKQSTVVMIFNINNINMFEREFVMPYYLNILNSNDLNSKLYRYLRGGSGLCYNVTTFPVDRSNILIVKTTILVGKESKAIRLIKKAIKDMKDNISNEEFIRAYYAYESSLKGMVDSIGAINRLYMNMYYSNFSSYNEKLENYKKVRVSDINLLASKIRLNTTYVLKGDINERDKD